MAPDHPAAVPNARCVVCGVENPHGLQLRFSPDSPGAVTAPWTTSSEWEGFQGLIHGGIISTVLDEAMSKAVAAMGWQALTCELRVRLRRHVSPNESVQVRGWVAEKRRRRILTEASLCDQGGQERAHAWATFLVLGHGQAQRWR